MAEMLKENGWLTPAAAARRAGVSVYRIERMVSSGSVKSFTSPGTKPLVNWDDIQRALAPAIRPSRAAAAASRASESTT